MDIIIPRDEEKRLRAELQKRGDSEAVRMRRYLAMPDLTRTPGSPLYELVQRITSIPDFSAFDVIHVPEILSTKIAFDLFDFPADHPARNKSDTYYVDDKHALRTMVTVMWFYYFEHKAVKEKLAKKEPMGVLSYGKVYRKDEIDNKHMNVFHQIDAIYIAPKETEPIDLETLKDVELKMVRAMFGDVESRFAEETFPYTHPSTEIEIKRENDWFEILGSGVVKPSVLKMLGVDPAVYNGWAFGGGLDRWAMLSMSLPDIRLLWSDDERVKKQLVLGQTYTDVSKYPPVVRDISFIVQKTFVPNDYFDTVREIVGDELVEEVSLIDKYENDEKFGAGNISYAYRITYRSLERTLTGADVDALHTKLESATRERYAAVVR